MYPAGGRAVPEATSCSLVVSPSHQSGPIGTLTARPLSIWLVARYRLSSVRVGWPA